MKKFNRKKNLVAIVLTCFFCLSMVVPAFADEVVKVIDQDKIKVVVFKIGDKNYYVEDENGNVLTKGMDAKPFIKSSRTFVPVRYLSYALGLNEQDISWDDPTKTVGLKGRSYLELVIGNKTMKSDGSSKEMDVAPLIKKAPAERTYLPARYVAEGLGFKVDWDDSRKMVICWPEDKPKPNLENVLKEIEEKPVEKPPVEKNPNKNIEEQFKELGKTGGIVSESQLTPELKEYIWKEIWEETDDSNVFISDDVWQKHRPLIMDIAVAQKQLNPPYTIKSIVTCKEWAYEDGNYKRSGGKNAGYVTIINGKEVICCTVAYTMYAELQAEWGGVCDENIFAEEGKQPEWAK